MQLHEAVAVLLDAHTRGWRGSDEEFTIPFGAVPEVYGHPEVYAEAWMVLREYLYGLGIR